MPWWLYFRRKTISLLGLSVIEKSTRWPSLWFLVVSSQILRLQAKIDCWCVKTSRLWVFVGPGPYYIILPTSHSKWGSIQGQLISCGKRAINFYDRGLGWIQATGWRFQDISQLWVLCWSSMGFKSLLLGQIDFLFWLGQDGVGWSLNPWVVSTSGLCKDDLGLEPSVSDPASPNYSKQLESDLFSQHTVLGFLTMSSTPKICEVEVFLLYMIQLILCKGQMLR